MGGVQLLGAALLFSPREQNIVVNPLRETSLPPKIIWYLELLGLCYFLLMLLRDKLGKAKHFVLPLVRSSALKADDSGLEL